MGMIAQKALTDLASYMVEALRPLTKEERSMIFEKMEACYCRRCGASGDKHQKGCDNA